MPELRGLRRFYGESPAGGQILLNGADLAHKFINFILKPDVAGRIINATWYAMPIPAAREYVEAEIRTDPNIFPSDSILARCEFLTDRGDFNTEMDRAWTELKMY